MNSGIKAPPAATGKASRPDIPESAITYIPSQSGEKLLAPKDVISMWAKLLDGLPYSTHEFYERLEAALVARQIPKIEVGRVSWMEGGFLSKRREYFRIKRERLVYDICAAQYGAGFFVSSRLAIAPMNFTFLDIFGGLFILGAIAYVSQSLNLFQVLLGGGSAILLLMLLMRKAVAWGIADLDSVFLNTPMLRVIYERFFRPLTYYRIDTALMYQEAVHASLMDVIDFVTMERGVKPLSAEERKPTLKALYCR